MGPTVFVVDSDASYRHDLSTLVRSVGLRAELFGSGEEYLRRKQPDLKGCLIVEVSLLGIWRPAVAKLPCGFDEPHSDCVLQGLRR